MIVPPPMARSRYERFISRSHWDLVDRIKLPSTTSMQEQHEKKQYVRCHNLHKVLHMGMIPVVRSRYSSKGLILGSRASLVPSAPITPRQPSVGKSDRQSGQGGHTPICEEGFMLEWGVSQKEIARFGSWLSWLSVSALDPLALRRHLSMGLPFRRATLEAINLSVIPYSQAQMITIPLLAYLCLDKGFASILSPYRIGLDLFIARASSHSMV
jgi:hypothetical protein